MERQIPQGARLRQSIFGAPKCLWNFFLYQCVRVACYVDAQRFRLTLEGGSQATLTRSGLDAGTLAAMRAVLAPAEAVQAGSAPSFQVEGPLPSELLLYQVRLQNVLKHAPALGQQQYQHA